MNAGIMKSTKTPTVIGDGLLPKDMIKTPKTFLSSDRHSNTTPEDSSEIWNVAVEQARMTLDATTQNHVRSAIMPLSQHHRMDQKFEPKRTFGNKVSDAMDPRCKGLHGEHPHCQAFANHKMFCEMHPIESKNAN